MIANVARRRFCARNLFGTKSSLQRHGRLNVMLFTYQFIRNYRYIFSYLPHFRTGTYENIPNHTQSSVSFAWRQKDLLQANDTLAISGGKLLCFAVHAVFPEMGGLKTGSLMFLRFAGGSNCPSPRYFSTSPCLHELRKLARVKVVDNSMLGQQAVLSNKPPRIVHVYNKKQIAFIGDKVLLAIAGVKKRAYVVGCRQNQEPNIPRFDSNNVVLVEDNGTPTGTRIRVPIPSTLRGSTDEGFIKILSIATKFV